MTWSRGVTPPRHRTELLLIRRARLAPAGKFWTLPACAVQQPRRRPLQASTTRRCALRTTGAAFWASPIGGHVAAAHFCDPRGRSAGVFTGTSQVRTRLEVDEPQTSCRCARGRRSERFNPLPVRPPTGTVQTCQAPGGQSRCAAPCHFLHPLAPRFCRGQGADLRAPIESHSSCFWAPGPVDEERLVLGTPAVTSVRPAGATNVHHFPRNRATSFLTTGLLPASATNV